MPAKLTRQQIKEGLEQMPIETLIIGAKAKERTLTAKQKAFARNIAMGKTGADSYREAYKPKGKAKTIGDNASRLKGDERIQAEIEAYTLAMEAAKHRTAGQLRELVIHRLTIEAMSEDNPPATRVQALKLLGTVSEVGAFTERKEVTTINQSSDIKAKLMAMLSAANNTIDITPNNEDAGASLLAELGHAVDDSQDAEPTLVPPPLEGHGADALYIHNIPHIESPTNSIPHIESAEKTDRCVKTTSQPIDNIEENSEGGNISTPEGVGANEILENDEDFWLEKAPLSDSEIKG